MSLLKVTLLEVMDNSITVYNIVNNQATNLQLQGVIKNTKPTNFEPKETEDYEIIYI